MTRAMTLVRSAAIVGGLSLVLAGCGNGDGNGGNGNGGDDGAALHLGTLLPVTGSLAQLGPPQIAGVDLAVEEINDAGGIFDSDVEVSHADSGDAEQAAVATESSQQLINDGVQVIIGAAASSVTLNVIDDITGAGVVMFSPANTTPELSGYSDFYYRTAPPDSVQGDALANLMLGDGHTDIGALVFNDAYGTPLRDVVETAVTDAGASFVHGSSGQEFDPNETNFQAIVSEALAADPDALAIIAFTTQTPLIINELAAQGFDMANTYYVDGNIQNFGDELDEGTLEGAQGTLPGANPSEEFRERLLEVDSDLAEFSYAAEAYDAAMISSLAALRGGEATSEAIQENIPAISGTEGGTECTGWEECSALIEDGEDIIYQALSGVGPFNDSNDPSSAFIGIYEFDEENNFHFQEAIEGAVPED